MRTLAAVLCLVSFAVSAQPTLVLVNGKIFDNPNAQAIAITGNTITAVGTNAEIKALATPETRVIDVRGRLVIPGINDAHTHPGTHTPSFVANENIEATWAQVAAAISSAADETPAELWITAIAGPAIITDANITNQTLDKLAPGRKVLVGSFTGHGAILSSAALKALDIGPDVKNPAGGAFGRDAQGNLNGRVNEYAHYLVDRRFADLASDDEIVSGIRAFSEDAVRYGITSVQAMPTPNEARFAKLLRTSGVPLRVRLIAFPLDGTPPAVESGGAVKFILDGTPIEHGAALRTAQYPDKTRGSENFPDLAPFVKLAVDNNAQLLVHTAGDKTVASALRSFEKTTLKRPRLEHADGLQPDLFPLAQKTGAVAVINPTHFPFRGAYPAGKYMLAKSIAAAKIPIAIGSDGPLNPYLNLMFATARPDQPAESLTREQALRAYTSGSAYAEFMETRKGKIAPGMLADLAVVSQNILEVPAEMLPNTRSVLTIIDGKVVHQEETSVPVVESTSLRGRSDSLDDSTTGPLDHSTAPRLDPTPSLILTNAKVFDNPNAQAIAIVGNRIVAVGTNDEIGAKATPSTRVIDVQGKLVIPGFNDAHTHFGWSGEAFLATRDFRAAWPAVRAAIAAAAEETPPDMWISGFVGQAVVLDPEVTNLALDKAAPGRKVALGSLGSHSMIMNSAAMAAFGIAPNAKDPEGGWYGRHADGTVNGHAYEYALWPLSRKLASLGTDEEIVDSIRGFSEEVVRYGVTTVQNMSFVPDDRFMAALKKANVPLRVRAILFPTSVDDRLAKRPGAGLKWFLDGSPVERTAAFRKSAYSDRTTGRENFRDVAPLIRKAVENKQQLIVHVVGDKAAESALHAFAKSSLQRPRLEHVHSLPSDLYPLMKQTGAIAVINPGHGSLREYYVSEGEYLPAASIVRAGIPLAVGSDGFPRNPFVQFRWMVDRKDENERLSREDALRAFTSGSAYAEMTEKEKGKIAPGMLADIAVLSQNILEVPADTLWRTRSVLTIIDGKVVHEER